MNWIDVGLSVVVGALVAFSVSLLTVKFKRPWLAGLIVCAGVTFALAVLHHQHDSTAKPEDELSEAPAFQTLKKYRPQAFKKIVDLAASGAQRNESKEQMIGQFTGQMVVAVGPLLPVASDRAVTDYAQEIVLELRELTKQNPQTVLPVFASHEIRCDRSVAISAQRTHAGKSRRSESGSNFCTGASATGAYQGKRCPESAADTRLNRAVHGNDVAVLGQLNDPGVDKKKACNMVADFYAAAAGLPADRAGPLLRFMLSGAHQTP